MKFFLAKLDLTQIASHQEPRKYLYPLQFEEFNLHMVNVALFLFRFMCRLNEQLKYFVTQKISSDSLWQDVTVILSGHETPGEGEHKIMDYIRHGKNC